MLKGHVKAMPASSVDVKAHIEDPEEVFVRIVNQILNTSDIRHLRRHGGSFAITIPKQLAESLKISEGDSLRLAVFQSFHEIAEMSAQLDKLNNGMPVVVLIKVSGK